MNSSASTCAFSSPCALGRDFWRWGGRKDWALPGITPRSTRLGFLGLEAVDGFLRRMVPGLSSGSMAFQSISNPFMPRARGWTSLTPSVLESVKPSEVQCSIAAFRSKSAISTAIRLLSSSSWALSRVRSRTSSSLMVFQLSLMSRYTRRFSSRAIRRSALPDCCF